MTYNLIILFTSSLYKKKKKNLFQSQIAEQE